MLKLKYNCKVYDRQGEVFTTLSKGQKIEVLEVDKRTVKIQWETDDNKLKYGYMAHRQFIINS